MQELPEQEPGYKSYEVSLTELRINLKKMCTLAMHHKHIYIVVDYGQPFMQLGGTHGITRAIEMTPTLAVIEPKIIPSVPGDVLTIK